jgi:hypothetical protein
MAKLSVHLFNCQSLVEGRRTFECTSSMVRLFLLQVFLIAELYNPMNKCVYLMHSPLVIVHVKWTVQHGMPTT